MMEYDEGLLVGSRSPVDEYLTSCFHEVPSNRLVSVKVGCRSVGRQGSGEGHSPCCYLPCYCWELYLVTRMKGTMKRDKGAEEGEDAFADEKDLQLLLAVAVICDDD